VTETAMVQVVCPECRQEFDVPDGAEEATCPNCSEVLVWRSCLDTNEVFTVLKKWETWVHPGCETKHPVDLTNVLSSSRPQDPLSAPIGSDTEQPEPAAQPQSDVVYAPVELSPQVSWPDQQIAGRLIVDSDRLAILPVPPTRPPLSVAWIRDVQGYEVRGTGESDGKRKLFGRKAKAEAGAQSSQLMLTVTGGQIAISSATPAEEFTAQLDQHLRPRLGGAAHGAVPTAPAPPAPQTQSQPAPQSPPTAAPPPVAPMAPPGAPQAPGGTTGFMPGPQTPAAAPVPSMPAPPIPPVQPAPGSAAAPQGPPQGLENVDLDPKTPEGVYDSIRKLAELAVLGTITSEEFATRKAQLLARL
jgi:predicted RNA-binding Zn-ribbon protein involved in translation (DUF1610 family)